MKVGIYCDDILPTQGGGYTITAEILEAAVALAPKSQHQFVLMSRSLDLPEAFSASPQLSYLSTQATPQAALRYKLRFVRTAFQECIKHPRNLFRIKPWETQFIEDLLRIHQLELVWHVSAHCCLSMEVPYMITVWDLAHRTQPYFPEVSADGQWSGREYGWSEKDPGYAIALRRATYILTGTEAGKAEIERYYQVSPERTKVLAFPVPSLKAPLEQDGEVLAKYELKPGYLFYPAQFWPHKNHINLLLALHILRERHSLRLIVVFSGSDQGNLPHIQALVTELDLSDQVRFLGFVPQSDLVTLYRNAFALTFVSFFGPDNLPPLEAFSLGCPVIAAKVDGALEQLGDAAVLVDPKDPRHIADAVKQLWDHPDQCHLLRERGLIRAQQRSREDYVQDVFGLIDEFAAVRRCWS